jgi:hypothetical protein
VWLPCKIEQLLAFMRQREHVDPSLPRIVHSDLAVVDWNLLEIAPSFLKYQRIDATRASFQDLLCSNCVTGCAALLNRPLLDLLRGDSQARVDMHDWWAALVASAFGEVDFLPRALTLYRQHGTNAQGAKRGGVGYFLGRARDVFSGARTGRHVLRWSRQASEFLRLHGEQLEPQLRNCAMHVASLERLGPLMRRWNLVRYGLLRQGALRNAATLLVA